MLVTHRYNSQTESDSDWLDWAVFYVPANTDWTDVIAITCVVSVSRMLHSDYSNTHHWCWMPITWLTLTNIIRQYKNIIMTHKITDWTNMLPDQWSGQSASLHHYDDNWTSSTGWLNSSVNRPMNWDIDIIQHNDMRWLLQTSTVNITSTAAAGVMTWTSYNTLLYTGKTLVEMSIKRKNQIIVKVKNEPE